MIEDIDNTVMGVALAMVLSVLRVVYDREETRPMRIVLESVICGLLSVAASAAINAMGWDPNWSVFAGGVIGYMGSTAVRAAAVKFITFKATGKS